MRSRFFSWLGALRTSGGTTTTTEDLRLANERLEQTHAAAGLTSWEWDIIADEMSWIAGRPNLVRLGKEPKLRYCDVVANVHPDDRQATLAAAYAAVANHSTFEKEFRVAAPNGAVRWILSRGKVSYAADGTPLRMLGVNMDITDRKTLEASIVAEKERFRAIFEQTAVGVGYVALEQTFHLANQKLCDLFGYTLEEITKKTVLELIVPEDRRAATAARDKLLASGDFNGTGEGRFLRRNGTFFWGELTASRVMLASDKPIMVIIIKDITERIEAELTARNAVETMTAALKSADAANLAKTHFVANMSHEIRTPLTAILGFSSLLRESVTDEKERKYIDTILRNGEALSQLINDILDLSKIEAERADLVRRPVAIRPLIAHLHATLSALITGHSVDLDFRCAEDVPDVLYTDGPKLLQLLVNVVGNAVKFTPRGSVTFTVALQKGGPNAGPALAFTVTDTGIGMTQEQQKRLFQPFFQADPTMTRVYGGTGLGLTLARRLAHLFGGELALSSSVPGKGSTFLAAIPIVYADPFAAHILAAEPKTLQIDDGMHARLAGSRVLLVEDSADSRDYLCQCFDLAGITVEVAADGQEAIEKGSASTFAVIFMDVQLPVLDGIEATRRLRELGCKTKIIALTAHALGDERDRCLLAGCNAYVTKPIRPGELLGLVDDVIQGRIV